MSASERETHLNMTGDDHRTWEVFTDDPFWQRRLEKFTAPWKIVGEGRHYRLNADQMLIRRGRRRVSDETRQALQQRLQTSHSTGSFEAQNGNGGSA
ncbi:MAG: hypothetical protein R2867_42135 [Caldilineaceae bacterium]